MAEILSRALRINAIVRKEIKSLISDRIAIVILFLIPVALIGVLGASEPRSSLMDATIWIIDEDGTPESQSFIETMKNGSATAYATGDKAPIEPKLGENEAYGDVSKSLAEKTLPTEYLDAYIVIPKGFAADLAENGTTSLKIYYDSIDMTTRMIADVYILLGLTDVQLNNLMLERDIYVFPETRPNDLIQEINILEIASPLFVGIMLFFSMNLVCTQAIVGDVPLKRMLNTSLRRGEVVTGKIMAYSIIAVFQIIITILMLQAFDVTIMCLWIDIFLLLLFTSITGVCIGMFISVISTTRLQASQLFLMIFFIMLIVQLYARNKIALIFMPLEQSAIAFANLAFRGASLGDVFEQVSYIIMTGAIFYFLTIIYIKYIKKEFV